MYIVILHQSPVKTRKLAHYDLMELVRLALTFEQRYRPQEEGVRSVNKSVESPVHIYATLILLPVVSH